MISIGLNLILGVLLVCALILGVRLERRLRGLRQSHTDFAKAVSELDQAAVRTESSLAALRAGTETAKGELASRIDQARIACQRLEKLAADAERVLDRPLPLSHPMQPLAQQPMALSQPIERPAPPLAQAGSDFARPDPEFLRPAAPVQSRPVAEPPARSRARLIDDDLFDFEAEVGAARGAPSALASAHLASTHTATGDMASDPLIGGPPKGADSSAREAFYREVLDREAFAPDPFASGRFAHERRAMLAAVMGGRR